MKSFDAIPVLKSRYAKIKRHYNNLLEEFDAEEIHQFRLNIKKLKVFLYLLNAGRAGKKELKLSAPILTFYHAVGDLRNVQLHRQEISRLCEEVNCQIPYTYSQRLHTRETKAKETARGLALQNSPHKYFHKLVNTTSDKVTEIAIENFVSKQKHELMRLLLLGNYSDECLHSIRKLLKGFIYLWPWAEAEIKSIPHCACLDKGDCIALSETLGDFQNCCITLWYLNSGELTDNLPAEEQSIIKALAAQIQNERQALKVRLVARLQTCVQELWEKKVLLPIYEHLQ